MVDSAHADKTGSVSAARYHETPAVAAWPPVLTNTVPEKCLPDIPLPDTIFPLPAKNHRVSESPDDAAREKGYDRSRWEKNAGTYGFAAPEQTGQEGAGNRVDERSDIYALGKTWYHLLTGQNPAHAPYGSQPLSCYVPDLVEGTEQIIRKMTRPLPEERYQSTEELEQVLEKLEQSDGRWDGRNGKKGWKRGRKSFFIRRIEEQIWLAQAKQEYTFYQDSCIMKSSQSGRSGQAGIPGKE